MAVNWKFTRYYHLPVEDLEYLEKTGQGRPRIIWNDGSVSVAEVDGAGEVIRVVARVLPTIEPKRGLGHKLVDPERDDIAQRISALPDLLDAAIDALDMIDPVTPTYVALARAIQKAGGSE